MKRIVLIVMLLVSSYCLGDELDVAHEYQEALLVLKVENNIERGRAMLELLLPQISHEHELYNDIYQSYIEASKTGESDKVMKAIAFATGVKEETICKGVGVLELTAKHNDGTVSTLMRSNFIIKKEVIGDQGVYDLINANPNREIVWTSGEGVYTLDTEYRKATKSDLIMDSSSKFHYSISETRANGDVGSWSGEWRDGHLKTSSNTSGSPSEPIPMFMAGDFLAWGTPDFAYRIKFEVGDVQVQKTSESMFDHRRINLIGTRRVVEKLKKYKNLGCFRVETDIRFAGFKSKK